MSSRGKINVAGILLTLAVIAFYGVLQWQANPIPAAAQIPPTFDPKQVAAPTDDPDPVDGSGGGDPPPLAQVEASIMFVLDGSQHMYPRLGENYFDLAKDAIVEFIDRRGFRVDGRYEVGVVQFTERSAPDYTEGIHWVALSRIVSTTAHHIFRKQVRDIERSTHHSAALMEVGIREATDLLDTQAAGPGQKHIILLTTGEYRLPPPCPPPCYSRDTDVGCWGATDCDLVPNRSCVIDSQTDSFCKRACPIRYFADQARGKGYTVSTVRLGVDWYNYLHTLCSELMEPYSNSPGFCVQPTQLTRPNQPDREGLLKEIANVDDCKNDGLRIGKYARINPTISFGCATGACEPGTAEDISDTIAAWLCEWLGTDRDGDTLPDLCDNCPDDVNPRQRDCNLNGVGDVCEWSTLVQCGQGTNDVDCDHVHDSSDLCIGGDDCLFREWTKDLECDFSLDPNFCGPDCDSDGVSDPCQTAAEVHDAAEAANAEPAPDGLGGGSS